MHSEGYSDYDSAVENETTGEKKGKINKKISIDNVLELNEVRDPQYLVCLSVCLRLFCHYRLRGGL